MTSTTNDNDSSKQKDNKDNKKLEAIDIDPKYLPPKAEGDEDINISDDPLTVRHNIEYALNSKLREEEERLEAKKREEEQAKVQERIRKWKEEEKLERERRIKLREQTKDMEDYQYRVIVEEGHFTCNHPTCNRRMTFFAECTRHPHTRINIDLGIYKLRRKVTNTNDNAGISEEVLDGTS